MLCCLQEGNFSKFEEFIAYDEQIHDSYMRLFYFYVQLTEEIQKKFLKGKVSGFDTSNQEYCVR